MERPVEQEHALATGERCRQCTAVRYVTAALTAGRDCLCHPWLCCGGLPSDSRAGGVHPRAPGPWLASSAARWRCHRSRPTRTQDTVCAYVNSRVSWLILTRELPRGLDAAVLDLSFRAGRSLLKCSHDNHVLGNDDNVKQRYCSMRVAMQLLLFTTCFLLLQVSLKACNTPTLHVITITICVPKKQLIFHLVGVGSATPIIACHHYIRLATTFPSDCSVHLSALTCCMLDVVFSVVITAHSAERSHLLPLLASCWRWHWRHWWVRGWGAPRRGRCGPAFCAVPQTRAG
jgi:hypothetical protein